MRSCECGLFPAVGCIFAWWLFRCFCMNDSQKEHSPHFPSPKVHYLVPGSKWILMKITFFVRSPTCDRVLRPCTIAKKLSIVECFLVYHILFWEYQKTHTATFVVLSWIMFAFIQKNNENQLPFDAGMFWYVEFSVQESYLRCIKQDGAFVFWFTAHKNVCEFVCWRRRKHCPCGWYECVDEFGSSDKKIEFTDPWNRKSGNLISLSIFRFISFQMLLCFRSFKIFIVNNSVLFVRHCACFRPTQFSQRTI